MQQRPAGIEVLGIQIHPAPLVEQLHDIADIFSWDEHLSGQDGLADFLDRIG